jgi:UDP-N-acetylglucosamine--N-acetylmuramyl-(pentapeptide) pyrophosphoryl-undecaprenol N-acetylglucosamine transferase
MNARPILIMAGGTGGHVFPALALARLLREQKREVIWLGTRRGLEARVVPAEGFPVEWLSVGGLRGKGPAELLKAPFMLALSVWQALRIIWRHKPGVVVGLGGFVAGPGGLAAWLLRRPLVVHEQNAIAGFTNRCLARLARTVLTAFPSALAGRARVRMIGNPVRADIVALPAPAERFAGRAGPLRLLVIGGSLGARRLNEVVPQALALLAANTQVPPFTVHHQAGEKLIDAARAAYAQAGVAGEVSPFIADMGAALGWADLVVCRAGALTIAELSAAGVGAVLVPFPHAVDDHQSSNARFLVDAGAARCLADSALTPSLLAGTLGELCAAGRDGLLRLAEAARRVARPFAARDLLSAVLAAEVT